MDFGDFGWRGLMLLAAFAASIYLVVALFGLARLRRRQERPVSLEPTSVPADDSSTAMWNPPTLTPLDPMPGETSTVTQVGSMFDAPQADSRPAQPFAATLAMTGLEAEVRKLRADVTALREELAEMKAARRVSPLYADAAALAQRGFDARGVAEECGISVAEAELVLAMSLEEKNFDGEVDDGGSGLDARAGHPGR
ncbi:MAG TPA: DUF2802 domain-containing protein [Rhodocyclaceae bacterium]|nr:DUF2802 domain-containing protein [Rhodocyclaceae bacterium]